MMTSSNGNIFRVTGPLCGEFTGPRWIPRTKANDAELWFFLDLRLNKRLSKQSWGWWFETPSRPLWRHCNANEIVRTYRWERSSVDGDQTLIQRESIGSMSNHCRSEGPCWAIHLLCSNMLCNKFSIKRVFISTLTKNLFLAMTSMILLGYDRVSLFSVSNYIQYPRW